MPSNDTIAAISTAPGRGGIGIVRLSGPEAVEIAGKLCRFRHPLAPGHARFGHLIEATGATLDEVVATFFAAPHSYTTEDVVELALHGAPVLLDQALRLAITHGARLAAAGEFTERAFPRRPARPHPGRGRQRPHLGPHARAGSRRCRAARRLDRPCHRAGPAAPHRPHRGARSRSRLRRRRSRPAARRNYLRPDRGHLHSVTPPRRDRSLWAHVARGFLAGDRGRAQCGQIVALQRAARACPGHRHRAARHHARSHYGVPRHRRNPG